MDGWIKIEDRLPDNVGEYIVYAQDENSSASEGVWYDNVVVVAEYAFGEWTWRENSNDFDITNNVTHWMPLPEPPEDFYCRDGEER